MANMINGTEDDDGDVEQQTPFTLVWAFGMAAVIGTVVYIIWTYLRLSKPWHAMHHRPLLVLQEEAEAAEGQKAVGPSLPPLSTSTFGWIFQVMSYDEEQVAEYCGMDALVFLTMLKFSSQFFIMNLPMAIAVGLVNGLAGDNIKEEKDDVWMNRLTIGNLDQEDTRMWVHFVGVLFAAVSFCRLAQQLTQNLSEMRNAHITNSAGPDAYSALVEHLDGAVLKEAGGAAAYFSEMFPGKVASVVELGPGLAAATKIMESLLAAIDTVENSQALREKLATQLLTSSDQKVSDKKVTLDAQLAKDTAKLNKLKADLDKQQQKVLASRASVGPAAAIVTFTTRQAAADCALNKKAYSRPAGTPAEFLAKEGNYEKTILQSTGAYFFGTLVSGFLIFFGIIPIIGISWLATKLADFLPEAIKGLTSGFIPVIVMIIFMIVVKLIFRTITLSNGVAFQREANRGISSKFFLFSCINIFLGFTISGMLIDSWSELTGGGLSFSDVLELFAVSIPKQSTYFISFFLVQTFTGMPMLLLDIGPLVVGQLKLRFMAHTEKAVRAAKKGCYLPFKYDFETPDPLLMLLIGVAYSTITPLIVPFAILYFIAAQAVFRYKFMYIHERPFETSGSMWPHELNRMFAILNVYIIFMAVIFGLQKGVQAVPTFLICPGAIYYQYCLKKKYYPIFYTSLPKVLADPETEVVNPCLLADPHTDVVNTLSLTTSAYDPPAMKESDSFLEGCALKLDASFAHASQHSLADRENVV